jgi:hypothetical protein
MAPQVLRTPRDLAHSQRNHGGKTVDTTIIRTPTPPSSPRRETGCSSMPAYSSSMYLRTALLPENPHKGRCGLRLPQLNSIHSPRKYVPRCIYRPAKAHNTFAPGGFLVPSWCCRVPF